EIFAVLLERLAQQFGIGGDEVRWRYGAGDLAKIELRLLPFEGLDALRRLDDVVRPFRGDCVGLAQEIKQRMSLPFGISEALVGLVERRDGRRVLAREPAQRLRPQRQKL